MIYFRVYFKTFLSTIRQLDYTFSKQVGQALNNWLNSEYENSENLCDLVLNMPAKMKDYNFTKVVYVTVFSRMSFWDLKT